MADAATAVEPRTGAGRRADLIGQIASAKARLREAEAEMMRMKAHHAKTKTLLDDISAELGRAEFTAGMARRMKNKLEVELAALVCATEGPQRERAL